MHIVLHFVVPIVVALALYRPGWRSAALVMLATMIVDVDHLLADPVYDPERCSIGFHPLHSTPAIALYVVLFALPLQRRRREGDADKGSDAWRSTHLAGLGLLIHMALDGLDCIL